MTIPVVVQMTVDSGTTYNLSADTNLQEIDLDNELEINVVSYDVPEYQGSYTVDAGLSPVVLNTQDKRLTQNVTVNALTENTLSNINLSVNTSNGEVTADVSLSAGYNEMGKGKIETLALPTQSARTITPTTSEQTAVASGKYTTGVVKVGAIPSQYADITGVTAQASDVLAGKYFVNNLGVLTLGTAIGGGGEGAPMPVDTVAEMIDTTKVYLYVGSETGYTFGNWYYYNGTAWVSGGKWGADGGVNTNARNLLDYILERVAYTETGMQVYVDALYEALAQAGTVTTDYTIINVLTNVTNSNNATGCEAGDSYTGTLTADTGYTIDTVTVTMGNVDITSTAYNNGVITIASVTGDIVITASATYWDYTWDYTMGLPNNNGFTLANTGNNTITLANNGLSIVSENSSSSQVKYTIEHPSNRVSEVITELVFEITGYSNNSGGGVRDNVGLGGGGTNADMCAELNLSQNGIQYLGAGSGWSTLSATAFELNTEYTVRIDQTTGNADIYVNGALVGTITSFREYVAWQSFGVYRGASAIIKSHKTKIIA